jgi:hypothetical protein
MLLLSRLTAIGAISNAFTSYLGFFWPVLARGTGRVLAISVVLGVLGAVNYFGVRYGTWVSNLFTTLSTVKRSLASRRSRPSAICDRAEFPVHRISTRFLSAM